MMFDTTKMQILILLDEQWICLIEIDLVNTAEKVFILNKTILNTCSNFDQHKTLTTDDKEPPWFTKKSKKSHLREKQCLQKLSK